MRKPLALLSLLFFPVFGCSPPEPVRIGFLGGLSGRVADLGIGGRNGALLAIELRNQQGGIHGRPIELIVEDDEQEEAAARRAAGRLLAHKVEVIVGPMTSSMALAVLPQMNAASVLLLSPTATSNALTGLDDQFFRVVAPTSTHAPKSADYQFAHGQRRLVLAYDLRNKAYSTSWATDFRHAFEARGGHVLAEVGFDASVSWTDLATNLLAHEPDGIVIIGNSVDTALLVQQVRMRDMTVRIATSEWAATERLIQLGGRAAEGIIVAQYIDRGSDSPAYRQFYQAYLDRFGQPPGFPGLTAFDATNVALDALSTKQRHQTLKEAILNRKRFPGAQSPIVFDAYGDAQRDTYLWTIRDGEYKTAP